MSSSRNFGPGLWRRLLPALALILLSAGCDGNRDAAEIHAEKDSAPPSSAPDPAAGHLERIKAAGILRIGVRADAPPFGFQDDQQRPLGFDVDLGFRLARHLEVRPVFVSVATQDRLAMLKRGEIDCLIATLTATRARARHVDFSMTYFEAHQGLLVKKGHAIKSYQDLSGKRVAVLKGSTSQQNLAVVAPDAQPVLITRLTEGLKLLADGQADALTGDNVTLQGLIVEQEKTAPSPYELAGKGFSIEPYAIGLPRGDSDLRCAVDEFLTELWTSGSWLRLFEKWLGPQTPYAWKPEFQMPILPE